MPKQLLKTRRHTTYNQQQAEAEVEAMLYDEELATIIRMAKRAQARIDREDSNDE